MAKLSDTSKELSKRFFRLDNKNNVTISRGYTSHYKVYVMNTLESPIPIKKIWVYGGLRDFSYFGPKA